MLWHLEVFLETVLVSLFILRPPSLRWFEAAIAVDWIANLLQLLPYRLGLHRHAQLIWMAGVALSAPLLWLAMVEAGEMPASGRKYAHSRILAFWIVAQLTCALAQTQFGAIPVNPYLLGCDALALAAWIWLLIRR